MKKHKDYYRFTALRDFGALKGSLSTLSKVKINDLKKINKDWSGLDGLDLAKFVTFPLLYLIKILKQNIR